MLYGSVSIVLAPEPAMTESPGTTSIRSSAELPTRVSSPEPPTSVSPFAGGKVPVAVVSDELVPVGVVPDGVAAKLYMNSS